MNRQTGSTGRRTAIVLVTLVALVAATFAAAAPALAGTAADRLTVLSRWTQTSAGSSAAWQAANANREAWASYRFDWSTDACSASPEKPLGFDFTSSCWRHDFGYRNYRAVKLFGPHKARLDDAFYADLKRACRTYAALVQPACYSLAWTYYQAVHLFGSLAAVSQADLDHAADLKAADLKAADLKAADIRAADLRAAAR